MPQSAEPSAPLPAPPHYDERVRALAIADALRMLIARAEEESLPVVALTLRLALADMALVTGAPQ